MTFHFKKAAQKLICSEAIDQNCTKFSRGEAGIQGSPWPKELNWDEPVSVHWADEAKCQVRQGQALTRSLFLMSLG